MKSLEWFGAECGYRGLLVANDLRDMFDEGHPLRILCDAVNRKRVGSQFVIASLGYRDFSDAKPVPTPALRREGDERPPCVLRDVDPADADDRYRTERDSV